MPKPSPLELLITSVYEACLFLDAKAVEELDNFEHRLLHLYPVIAADINSRMERQRFFYCLSEPVMSVIPQDVECFYHAWRHGKDRVAPRTLDVLVKALPPTFFHCKRG